MTLTAEQITKVFADAVEQADYIIGLHKLIYPDWDDIAQLNGFVKCSKNLSLHICGLCIEWDKAHRIKTLPGGAWLQWGFSSVEDRGDGQIGDWEVIPAPVVLKKRSTHSNSERENNGATYRSQ